MCVVIRGFFVAAWRIGETVVGVGILLQSVLARFHVDRVKIRHLQ